MTEEEDAKFTKLLTYCITGGLIVVVLSLTTCRMHSNSYEAEVEAEVTKQIQAKMASEQQRLAALKDLIDSGVNAVAARCAIKGWSGSSGGDLA